MVKHSTKEEYNAYMRDYMLRRYHRRRKEAIEHLGGKCVRCGSQDGLEFDHIDPETKLFDIARRMAGVAETKFWEEINKCQLLCATHHQEKTLQDNGQQSAKTTHGTLSSYRYCKCEKCREVKSRYNREYRARNTLP